jgi:hypothetical protein
MEMDVKPTNTSQVNCDTKGTSTMGHGVMVPTTTPSGCKWFNTWRLHWVNESGGGGEKKQKFPPPSWMVDGKA